MPTRRFRDIFDFMEDMMRQFEEEFREMEKEFEKMFKEGKQFGPYVYGFRITVGPDGKPVVEEFGNVKRSRGRPIISEEREPLVDVIEREDEIRVVAELPGVDKNNIKLRVVNGNKLIIQAQSEERKYYKEIELPAEVDEKLAKATYKNGVLDVVLKKKSVSEKGTEIKIE
ncbi:MAG: archaeal heat shock protein Hsp20 [Sulfolobaceae archaeon]